MTDTLSAERIDLLSLCAVLRWFDRELLLELTDQPEEAIETLLASDLAAPAAESGTRR